MTVPSGWSAPSTAATNPGYTTATAGGVGLPIIISGQTLTVNEITRSAGQMVVITYGSKASGGPGATAPGATGTENWQAKETSLSLGTLTNLSASTLLKVCAANGTGIMRMTPVQSQANSTGNTLTLRYTAAAGGLLNGTVTVRIPNGWSPPPLVASNPGFTTASTGTGSLSGSLVTVSGLNLVGGSTTTIVYGNKGSGGPGRPLLLPERSKPLRCRSVRSSRAR